ncbi:MAG: hypothetical protein NZ455_14225 [Bacteroidia bacterium]|nr:hypothetical protein [Bacteroidia bacterium]MDW8347335.1 hypothetical protein [Bacteroidia bacterium]
MREARGGQAVRLGAQPHARSFTLAQGAQHRQPVARRPERSEGHAQNTYQL